MNIIETVRDMLERFPKIADVCNEISVDFANPEPTSYGLSSVGDKLVSEDILGNQTRQHSFLFYSTFSGINDFERLSNSEALTELAVWLSRQAGTAVTTEVDSEIHNGEITTISAGNGMLYAVPQSNRISGMRYQLQIEIQYTVNF